MPDPDDLNPSTKLFENIPKIFNALHPAYLKETGTLCLSSKAKREADRRSLRCFIIQNFSFSYCHFLVKFNFLLIYLKVSLRRDLLSNFRWFLPRHTLSDHKYLNWSAECNFHFRGVSNFLIQNVSLKRWLSRGYMYGSCLQLVCCRRELVSEIELKIILDFTSFVDARTWLILRSNLISYASNALNCETHHQMTCSHKKMIGDLCFDCF